MSPRPALNVDALQDLMEARGIDSVSELSRRSGVDRSLCSRILSGERKAAPSQIVAFTRALGARPLTLLAPTDPADAILAMAEAIEVPA